MRKYENEIVESASNFFEEIAMIVQRPIEALLSDTLFKQVEMINRNVSESAVISDRNMP